MSNELALKMSSDALQDFNKIDEGHKGYLNLLDIHNYENQGPQQKVVGQFLERNYDSIRTASGTGSDVDSDGNDTAYITIPDLNLVKQLSDPAKTGTNQDVRVTSDVVVGGMAGGAGALFGTLGAGAVALVAGAIFAPAAVPAFWATEAVETAAATYFGGKGNDDTQTHAQSVINSLR
jgi:hypothetical protein